MATALADAGGLGAVTMRAIAAELGTTAASLYRYVRSRDELLELVGDAALGELDLEAPTDDRLGDLVALARRLSDLYRRHRWLIELTRRPSGFGPSTLAYFEACLRILAPLPATSTAKLEAIAMTTGIATLFAQAGDAGDAGTAAARILALARPDAHPHLLAALRSPSGGPAEVDLLERTMRSVLTGLLGEP